jgi:TolA-binding protein
VTIDPLKMIFTSDARLDDMKRARIWASLAPRVASAAPRRRRWPIIACASVAAVAALAVLVLGRREHTAEHVVPRGAALALPLGPATRAVIEGPARISVEREGKVTSVALRAGTLYGEFTGGDGRSLRIDAAGSTIEIVGTLFSVSVVGDTACLAVAHGRVRMTSATVAIEVDGGQRACAVRGSPPSAVAAIDASSLAALTHYQHTWLADAGGVGSDEAPAAPPAPTSVAVSVPAVAAPHPSAPAVQRREATTATVPEPHADRGTPAVDVATVATADVPPPPTPDATDAGPTADAAQPATVDEDLYKAADEAIAHGDPATAERTLSELLARMPQSPLADEARYERARLAFDRQDWPTVRKLVADVKPTSPLREPAAYLGCRAAREIGLIEARACLSEYLTAFPKAPHALDALAQLVDIAFRMGGCDAITIPLAQLRAASPTAPALETWHRRCGSQ